MPAASYHNRPSKKHGNFRIANLKIFDFFKSDFSYLPSGKTRKVGCLKISDFSESDFSYLALGKTRKVGCEKVRKKTSSISEVSEKSEFSTWPSRNAELYGRVCGVKWVQLFLMYFHPSNPDSMRDPLSGWR